VATKGRLPPITPAPFEDLVQDGTGVVGRFANGAHASADALIGCDGVRSIVRDKVHGSAPVTYTGQVAFRALVPAADLPQEIRTVRGPHGRDGDQVYEAGEPEAPRAEGNREMGSGRERRWPGYDSGDKLTPECQT
jgi:2-polyprenyl-6-methoxyphenol hydroxylase-like FAD-dependent oxidoreductase